MNKLVEIADGVFGVNTEFKLGAGVKLPLRMTVLRDGDGLALVAPIPIDDALAQELSAHGPVRHLLAPNLLHHAYVAAAQERYPEARALAAPGLADKRKDLSFDGELGTGELSEDIRTLHVQGADKLSEVVFLHRPSRTLVVTDLVFNIRDATGMSKFVLAMMSRALGRVEQSRLCRWLTTDRDATARSVEDLLALDFDRVVMAHGEVIERDAKAELTAGLWWMRGESRRPAVAAAS